MSKESDQQFIATLLHTKELHLVTSAGVGPEWLVDLGSQQALMVILEYASKVATLGQVPPPAYLQSRMVPLPPPYNPSMGTMQGQLDVVRTGRLKMRLAMLTSEATALMAGDPEKAYEKMLTGLMSQDVTGLMSKGRADTQTEVSKRLFESYVATQHTEGLVGLPTPFECLNYSLKGLQHGDMYCLFAPVKSFKCASGQTEILQRDGTYVRLADCPDVAIVQSFTEATGRMRWTRAEKISCGQKACLRVTTKSGRSLVAGQEHYFMVPGFDYTKAQDLKLGDWLVFSSSAPDCDETGEISPEDGHLLGLLTGDGGMTQHLTFTKQELSVVRRLAEHVTRWSCFLRKHGTNDYGYSVVRDDGRRGVPNPLITWLRDLGQHGKKSIEKACPEAVFRSGQSTIAAYLAGLMDTDGGVMVREKNGSIIWSTSSPQLAVDLRRLLGRVGVRARCLPNPNNGWTIAVSDKAGFERVRDVITPYMCNVPKLEKIKVLATRDTRFKPTDGVPETQLVRDLVLREMAGKPWPRRDFGLCEGKQLGPTDILKGRGVIGRKHMAQLAVLSGSESLKSLAVADVRYEQVVAIEDAGVQECFDFHVLDQQDANYVADDFVVHNSYISLLFALKVTNVGKRVLYVTSEMPAEQCGLRFASMASGINVNDWRDRKLSVNQAESVVGSDLHNLMHYFQPTGLQERAIGEVYSEIQRLNWDGNLGLVIWDGHYRSAKSSEWNDMYDFVRATRALALDKSLGRVPLLVVTQEGSKAGQSGYKVYEQEASLMLYLRREALDRIHAFTQAIRDGLTLEFKIHVDFGSGAPTFTEQAPKFLDGAPQQQKGFA